MNVASYLDRIRYNGPRSPGAEALRGLHVAHMYAVPFENLDILPLHRPILLDEASLWNKIVARQRGGFCYELNGMFAWLLKQTGFDVTYLNARVFSRDGKLGIDFDHLALLVQIPGQPGRFLADVGFGDSFNEPLVLEEGEQPQNLRAYRLESTGGGYVVWRKNYDGSWEREYFFDLAAREFPRKYEAACQYHQKSPQSSFTRHSIISRATPTGRISLEEARLIITENGKRSERLLEPGEWAVLLKQHFGVTLEAADQQTTPQGGQTHQQSAE